MFVRRLLAIALLVPVAAWLPTGVAAADLTVPTALPTTVPPVPSLPVATPSVPATLPTMPVAEPSVALPSPSQSTSAGTATPSSGPSAPAVPTALPGLPSLSVPVPSLPALPGLPSLPGAGGGGQAPPVAGGGQSSPLGEDVLPAELEAQLCSLLTTITGHLPGEVRGLPARVIAQLPAQITSAVPADVLRTITLQCPAPAPSVRADLPITTEFQATAARPLPRQVRDRHSARLPVERTALGSLPHTGLVVGLPLLGLGLLLAGTLLYRRSRPTR